MPRYRICIEYKGTNYVGWQRQENGPSIQEEIEDALKKLTGKQMDVFGAGRTDSGVHALGQIAHFDSLEPLKLDTIRDGINQYLRPQPIAIITAEEVNETFHARFSAKQRQYCYKIVNRRSPLTIHQDLAWVYHKRLDILKMKQAARYFEGQHDLNAFRSAHCQSETSIKTIDSVDVEDLDEHIVINVCARSFLHSQVRIMTGTLVYVGEGKIVPESINEIIRNCKRNDAGPTAPAEGLYLKKVIY